MPIINKPPSKLWDENYDRIFGKKESRADMAVIKGGEARDVTELARKFREEADKVRDNQKK